MSASENNWEPARVGPDACEWVTVPGSDCNLQLQKGWPSQIMSAVAADFHAYIEPLRDGDSAAWTPTNSVPTSNHLNATAMDLNWDSHPFHVKGTFSTEQMRTIRALLQFYEDTIFWAGDWNDPIDEMHWQMGYDTYNNPHTGDVIARKIRTDGYSTFRRDVGVPPPPPPPPPPPTQPAEVFAQAVPNMTLARAQEIQVAVTNGLLDSECTNVDRIAMWLAQIGHESANFRATEEFADGSAYEGRTDLGNTEPGDGPRFKGRTWIQVTGRHNYSRLSQWAYSKGMFPTATYFVDHPTELADIRYAGMGPAWYWTVERPQINSMCDRQDLEAVTRAINGGLNGLANRRDRYQQALAQGSALLTLTAPGTPPQKGDDDLLSALSPQEQRALYDEIMGQRASRSPLRHLDEGAVGDTPDISWAMDGNVHILVMLALGWLNEPGTIALLHEVASADPARYPDRQWDAQLAQAILATLTSPRAAAVITPPPSVQPPGRHAAPDTVPAVVVAPAPVRAEAVGEMETILGAVDLLNKFNVEYRKRFDTLTGDTHDPTS